MQTKKRYDKAIKVARDLAISRNKKYGNSIEIMKDSSILDLCLMKLIRTRELENDPKFTDELYDVINYLVYILMRRS